MSCGLCELHMEFLATTAKHVIHFCMVCLEPWIYHYIVNHYVKIWHVRLVCANNMRPLSWGGGAKTEGIRNHIWFLKMVARKGQASLSILQEE